MSASALPSGAERYHCLDTQGTDLTLASYNLMRSLVSGVRQLHALSAPGAEEALARLRRAFPHTDKTWCVDTGHYWQLRNSLDREKVGSSSRAWASIDTPAGLLSRAFKAYRNRLALGIPDPQVCTGVAR